ncbi:hypothetical protein L596_010415 [Steinernema carpocapsae]|uniref:E3 ubiquitin-protein transferase MAEA n=1 Tax=Steinernema carpocapsae TaxID=34508 RepID=A0A4U5PIU7_STECR|nr:hypothetical protein L596_010415 [Steinernema carpocapsae]
MTNEVKSLEYSVLKIPYEILNKRFRSSQKEIDKLNHKFEVAAKALDQQIPKDNEPVPLEDVEKHVPAVAERIRAIHTNLVQSVVGEISVAEDMERRLQYFQKAETAQHPAEHGAFKKERIDRMIIEHLYRTGCFKTASMLADSCKLKPVCNDLVYEEVRRVEDGLRNHDLNPCLDWIFDNRSKLRRLQSDFEMDIRIQECIEMMRDNRKVEAMKWVRKCFGHIGNGQWEKRPNLKQVAGMIAAGNKSVYKSYRKMYGEDRWEALIQKFRMESERVFMLSQQSAFSTCLQTGIAALKTPCCMKSVDTNCRCSVCHPDVYDLAEGLPIRHSTQSSVIWDEI